MCIRLCGMNRPATLGLGLLALTISFAAAAIGQTASSPLTPPPNGPRHSEPGWHALVHAKAVTAPGAGNTIEDATIVFRHGVIESVAAGGAAPAGARVWDCTGLTVYPGFVEPYLPVETPRADPKSAGAHWNSKVQAQRMAVDGPGASAEQRKKLRALGYTSACIVPSGGIFAGVAGVVSLSEQVTPSAPGVPPVIKDEAFNVASFETGGFGDEEYPSAKMGAIALIRQTLLDADWWGTATSMYSRAPSTRERPAQNDALERLGHHQTWMFISGDDHDAVRFAAIVDELDKGRPVVAVGNGGEYRRAAAIKAANVALIEPLSYPRRPKVQTLGERENVALRELMAWEQAPTNLRRLDAAGLKVAVTASRLEAGQDFMANLRDAVAVGLSEEKALAMVTTTPAEMLGLGDRLGQIAPGFAADLVVMQGTWLNKEREIRDVWVDGERNELSAPKPAEKLAGSWEFSMGADQHAKATLKITKKGEVTMERPGLPEAAPAQPAGQPEAKPADAPGADADRAKPAKPKSLKFTAKNVTIFENRIDFTIEEAAFGQSLEPQGAKADEKGGAEKKPAPPKDVVMVSGIADGDALRGRATMPGGAESAWAAKRLTADPNAKEDDGKDEDGKKASEEKDASAKEGKEGKKDEVRPELLNIPEQLGYPFAEYSMLQPPEQKAVVFRHATIWTQDKQYGVIKDGALYISGGKIKGIGRDPLAVQLPEPVTEIDLTGKTITPGLIDCHSHTGISGGVNEGTQACTAEVRIGDVINPDDVAWYRELAGGLTTVNQLHGSANPIGGQNSVAKIRWGSADAAAMKFAGAIPGIKFALGENVKQSNWGDRVNTRYPQTRMGVETFIRDRFDAAREYAKAMADFNALEQDARAARVPPQRDLELDALAEILAGQRLIHCHSYRQDEILMLCRLADSFGFKIGTFQHVLEGYKVAEAIRKSAIGGSCFSDWWAYKWEVYDAIPYDGAIMHDAGITVSFNSDSDELARRMNAEAGKAVKYGGLEPSEALAFVTINPAKQLKIDDKVGSITLGKDADLAVWSGSPLSPMSRCERTFVDGREYFSLEQDKAHRARIASERARIIQKLLVDAKREGGDHKPGAGGPGGSGVGVDSPPAGGRRRRSDTPPQSDLLRAGGWMTPAGGDDEEMAASAAMQRLLKLQQQFEFLQRNGIDPMLGRPGVCGCDLFSN